MDTPRRPLSKNNNVAKIVLPVLIIVVLLIVVGVFALRKSHDTTQTAPTSKKVTLPQAKASQVLNKTYAYSLKDGNGKQVSTFRYTVDSVEKRDEIIVQGKRDVAISGRSFLIVNLRIVNSYSRTIQINTRDYIRLTVDNSTDKLAADIHNDPVEVQPDSTKITRLGFPINDSDKDLTLLVGELSGKKETIKLSLR